MKLLESKMSNQAEYSFNLRFLGEQVLHCSYSSSSYGWLAHKLASFSEADNAVVVKIEEEGLTLRKLDTSSIITRLPFAANCQCFIHNREMGLFSVVGADSENIELHRLLVFRAPSVNIIKDFSSCLRKAVLASTFNRKNSTKSLKTASHVANFFEVYYLGRARFSNPSNESHLTPEFVDRAVNKLGQEITSFGGKLPSSRTFACDKTHNVEDILNTRTSVTRRPRAHTIADAADVRNVISSKTLTSSSANRTILIQLTESEVFLISPTSKTILLRVPFSDITAGCQGLENPDCFAFLTSVSDSLATTESSSLPSSKGKSDNLLFSPSQSCVNTKWAYIFCMTDDHASSNAVLSLRTCIRDPVAATSGIVLKESAFVNTNTGNGINENNRSTISKMRANDGPLMCDACPVRAFNAICSELIDFSGPDDERLQLLNDYINSSQNLSAEDVAFVRQLLPGKLSLNVHALICDVVFALFQLAEFNRTTHVHTFESSSSQKPDTKSKKPPMDPNSNTKKSATLSKLGTRMLTSSSFSGPSFVDVLREKINSTTKRRGSLTNALFPSSENNDKTAASDVERLYIDLRQLVSKKHSSNTTTETGNGDIFREYVVISKAEISKLPPPPPPPERAISPLNQGTQLKFPSETPKSLKSWVPGSEPAYPKPGRRCTVDVNILPSSAMRSSFRTPLARFEQYQNSTPGFGGYSTRKARLASINVPATPDHQHVHLQTQQLSARRRSIFEMVICPGSCSNIASVVKPLPNPTPTEQPAAPVIELTPANQTEKQLDYEEPLGGCSEECGIHWEELIGMKPDMSKEQVENLERLIAQGIPKQMRGRVWTWLIKRELSLLSKRSDKIPSVSPQEYADLLTLLTPCNQQILMDLGRTFPNHDYFSQHFGTGQLALFNILKAYSLIDPEVGYCQGISFVAGVLLMHSSSEYDAFNLLLALMFGFNMRTLYLPSMEGLHRCLYQLTRLLDAELPATFELLTANDVMPVFFASPWFVTLFSSQFPLGFVVRVFDLVFYGNMEMVFRVIFSLFSINEPLLLSRHGGFEDVVDFLKTTFTEMSVIQLERIVTKVFSLDFVVDLHRFGVEYDIYREEQDVSPARLIENVALTTATSSQADNISDDLSSSHPQLSVNDSESAKDLAAARHKVVELRAERSELMEKISEMQQKILAHENEIMRLEALNETLRAENAILRSSVSH